MLAKHACFSLSRRAAPSLPPAAAYECKPTSWPRIFFWAFAHARFRSHTHKTVACASTGWSGWAYSRMRKTNEGGIDTAGEICASLSIVFLNESLFKMCFIYDIRYTQYSIYEKWRTPSPRIYYHEFYFCIILRVSLQLREI